MIWKEEIRQVHERFYYKENYSKSYNGCPINKAVGFQSMAKLHPLVDWYLSLTLKSE